MMTPRTDVALQIERDVVVTMRDGTKLYADVWCPAKEGRFPVLLSRSPYNKTVDSLGPLGLDPVRAVERGYVVIYQDCRGRFASEGEWTTDCDAEDGYDTVEWAAQLPYSDGNIGMFGISYLGFTQWMAASAKPPHLKAIFPQQPVRSMREFAYRGGALDNSGTFWHCMQLAEPLMKEAAADPAAVAKLGEFGLLMGNLSSAFAQLPLLGGNPVLSENSKMYCEWLEKAEDDDYWAGSTFVHRLKEIDIPIFHLGSWYDTFAGETAELFGDMQGYRTASGGASDQKMMMGPWAHGQLTADYVGDLDVTAASSAPAIDLGGVHLRWFDHWLKGEDTGFMDEAPVRLFVMGDNVWRDEQEWPLARTEWTDFHLHSQGHANGKGGDGWLDTAAPTGDEPQDRYTYDPADPVPTVGGTAILPGLMVNAKAGPKDQVHVEQRGDVLVYESAVLEEDLEVTGPVSAVLYASSSAPDTDWTVMLADVHPDGRAYNIVDGIQRARYRKGMSKPEPITPGKVYRYTIDLMVTSNVFKAGHRLRVQVSSSNFPQFARNLNTGNDIPTDSEIKTADQTIYHDAEHPSHIKLPVIPRK